MSRGSVRQAAVLGIFTAGGLVIFVLGLLAVANLQGRFSQKVTVTTRFNDANGLTRGAAIWFSGVPVGTVQRLTLNAQSDVRVEMGVDPDHAQVIPADANAYISSDGFIGNTIVVLTGGSPEKAGLIDGSTLEADQTLTAEQIISEVRATNEQLQQIAADLKIVTGKISAGEGTVGKLITEEALYTRIDETTVSLQSVARNADVSARELARFTRTLNRDGGLVDQIANDETTYPALVSSVESLSQTAATLQQATASTDTPIGVLMQSQPGAEDLEGTLENLEESTALLEDTLDTLQESWLIRRNKKRKERKERKDN